MQDVIQTRGSLECCAHVQAQGNEPEFLLFSPSFTFSVQVLMTVLSFPICLFLLNPRQIILSTQLTTSTMRPRCPIPTRFAGPCLGLVADDDELGVGLGAQKGPDVRRRCGVQRAIHLQHREAGTHMNPGVMRKRRRVLLQASMMMEECLLEVCSSPTCAEHTQIASNTLCTPALAA